MNKKILLSIVFLTTSILLALFTPYSKLSIVVIVSGILLFIFNEINEKK